MPTYNTPGVYVEEISKLPGSVASVATAIPAFIGYTALHEKNAPTVDGAATTATIPKRITSMIEFEELFGGPDSATDVDVTIGAGGNVASADDPTISKYLMYTSLQFYFANGGGPCYIVSVNKYQSAGSVTEANLSKSFKALEMADEPTLLVFPSIKNITTPTSKIKVVYDAALAHSAKMQDRFVIMDAYYDKNQTNLENADDFRNQQVSSNNLSYGAAYYPELQTSIPFPNIDPAEITFDVYDATDYFDLSVAEAGGILEATTLAGLPALTSTPTNAAGATVVDNARFAGLYSGGETDTVKMGLIQKAIKFATSNARGLTLAEVDGIMAAYFDGTVMGFPATIAGGVTDARFYYNTVDAAGSDELKLKALQSDLGSIITDEFRRDLNGQLAIKAAGKGFGILGPASAMAGVYASVDRNRGVWKAPANVSLNAVVKPITKITDGDQEGLNVDPTSGKSINAIRTFSGKGTLVWGARTLAGNDNEWRYVNVRRLFINAEESIKKATEFVVFEPNDANTWTRVKVMIENYLTGIWKDGALAGATPEDAYYVNVGLGSTMSSQDILEGRMIVEIGMAAVRPAEFIILKFSHKLQVS